MPAYTHVRIDPPEDWAVFERGAETLWTEILGSGPVKRYGRRGQEQFGLDIVGYRNGDANRLVGVQLKAKGTRQRMKPAELRDDFLKAISHHPELAESDHCPFRYDDSAGKLNAKGKTSFRHIPNGIPGVETRLPILFSEGVMKGRIDLSRFVALTATNHAKVYGLTTKGRIAVGMDADIAIWDPDARRTIRHADLHDGADYTPYEGLEIRGWPTTVVLGGKVMIRNGTLTGRRGDGRYRSRARSEASLHSAAGQRR